MTTTHPRTTDPRRAIVLLSGGLDSAACLAIAKSEGFLCHALSFDYGQRHLAELAAAERIAHTLGAERHKIVRLDLTDICRSALTDRTSIIPQQPDSEIPSTYVPARNTIFLAIALGWAETVEARHIFIGVNAIDYSGYPDCRPGFITAFARMANLGTKAGIEGRGFTIHTPLLEMGKADIIRTGSTLGIDFAQTVSCYQANDAGEACGLCDACRLRRAGFEAAGVTDPTRYTLPITQKVKRHFGAISG
uniref:7-cyano-7-deazaguanine synthase n=1 Tax=Candidatus Kentrum sp. FM TaxID=2126340 RepID=A0A450SCA9_9GAMM|nr:MAG: 7-cyano-7-deazaguanine synthase [Candidatus Kentron sp. FM]VFJ52504.1 MAG: 7-cyano-7-deazaguanine synthase [Candidatus Kentron sp. FM]VFK09551.1 MAG: 7-cyano-7-deazaguanine synthase [Candidatus Kentron sp. FM]